MRDHVNSNGVNFNDDDDDNGDDDDRYVQINHRLNIYSLIYSIHDSVYFSILKNRPISIHINYSLYS